MYGDIGHGMVLLVVGSWAICKEDELRITMPMVHACRYILFMTGFFSTYVGLIYNDFFSVGLDLFGSRWVAPLDLTKSGELVTYESRYDTVNKGGLGPYPLGVDPAWHGAQNELIYVNSMK